MFGKLKAALSVVWPMDSWPGGLAFRVFRQIQPVLGLSSQHRPGQGSRALHPHVDWPAAFLQTGQGHSPQGQPQAASHRPSWFKFWRRRGERERDGEGTERYRGPSRRQAPCQLLIPSSHQPHGRLLSSCREQ